MSNLKEYSVNDVAQHCTNDDLWLIYDGKVYDMTKYFPQHPGGIAMLRRAGQDVSNVLPFVKSHGFSWSFIEKKLAEHCIGKVK
ncbi:unnamed protein product, partial [Mesorhabditis belari]|uniref:Cytochrome b5 heme-binding domain-containing protein n=1 Tax=Mesorhabditis belari TaxID=2138241 RepID=A0AAF3FRX9_9BILA